MKISWGIKIAATYIIFVGAVIIMVLIFMNQDVNLVSDDYYAQEIAYQQQIDKENRTHNLTEQLQIQQLPGNILFKFPDEFRNYKIQGRIDFYRPSDSKKDFSLGIECDDSGNQTVDCSNIARGLWKIKVDWTANGLLFYNESTIILE